MCIRPILIDNPYKGLKYVGLNRYHDTTSAYIPVPCGNCPSCIALRQSYFVQRCQMESLDCHLFMLTLTYSTPMIRSIDVNGRRLFYADWTDFQKMCKRLRNRGLKFRYLAVSEYGGNKHRPHFHAIISIPKGDKDTYHDILNLQYKFHDLFLGEWRRNYGSDSKPKYKDLCEKIFSFRGRTFDFHYIDPSSTDNGESDVAFYVTKYVTKSDKWVDKLKSALKLNLSNDKFVEVWKLLKPRCCVSKGFGNYSSDKVKLHVRKGIQLSLDSGSEFPYFINPYTGQTFPLAPTFKKRFLTLEDQKVFFSRSPHDDGYHETNYLSVMQHKVRDEKLSHIRKSINSKLTSYDFVYNEDINNISPESLEKNIDCPDILPDDWVNYNDDFKD